MFAAKANVKRSANANEPKSARMTNATVEARIVMTTTDATTDAASNDAASDNSASNYSASNYSTSYNAATDAAPIRPPSDVRIDVVGDLRLAFAATKALLAHAPKFESIRSNTRAIVSAWIWKTWILFLVKIF